MLHLFILANFLPDDLAHLKDVVDGLNSQRKTNEFDHERTVFRFQTGP